MDHTDGFFWLRLSRRPGVGPKTLWRLAAAATARSLTVRELIDAAAPDDSREVQRVRSLLAESDTGPLTDEWADLQARGISILHPGHPCFPAGVAQHGMDLGLSPVLFGRGHLPLAHRAGVAIIGSRTVEEDGVEFARGLAAQLARDGVNVVSGYAKGADVAAHAAALGAGGTTTVSFGLGILNFEARSEIKPLLSPANTLVLSPFHPRAGWASRNTPARDKLMCALARAVVVVGSAPERDEQGRASSTFEAARTALAMKLPVFVLSPEALRNPPPGNAALIQIGCRELFADEAAAQITSVLQGVSEPRALEPPLAGV